MGMGRSMDGDFIQPVHADSYAHPDSYAYTHPNHLSGMVSNSRLQRGPACHAER
jgi:hypothetical protein